MASVAPTRTRVRFRPLFGEGPDEPLCGVLEIDGCTILLDVGSTERFELEQLEPLRELAPSVDAVVLSHPDLAHLGGLAYAYGALGLRCPVYATLPVWRMGQMFMYDAFQARATECGGQVGGFDLDDVDQAFAHVTQLKYSQTVRLGGPRGLGVSLTPLPAGRTLGGALWRIRKEAEDVVYAPDLGAEQERLFNATALPSLRRPSALITTAHALSRELPPRKQRVSQFVSAAISALRSGCPVLVPVDSGGRCLEIAHTLDLHWAAHKLAHYPIALVGHTALNTLEFAKAQMEWMSDAVIRSFDVSGQPLSFKHVCPCHSLPELAQFLAEAPSTAPALVLVSTEACDMGLSRALLAEWLAEPERLVLLTGKGPPDSAARRLLAAAAGQPAARTVRLPRWVEVPLVGDALEAWRERRAAQARADAARRALRAAAAAPAGAEALLAAAAPAAAEAEPASAVESVLALAQSAVVGAHPIMPFAAPRPPRADEWGEALSEPQWGELARVAEAAARDSGDGGMLARTASANGRGAHGGGGAGVKRKLGAIKAEGGHAAGGEEEADEEDEEEETRAAAARRAALIPGSMRHRLANGGAAAEGGESGAPPEEEGAAAAELGGAPAEPTEWVAELGEPTAVRCQLLHVDLSGDADARAFRALLNAVAPRALALLRARPPDKLAARAAAAKAGCRRAFAPARLEWAELSSGVQTLRVRLPDEFLQGLSFEPIGQWEVARVRAQLCPAGVEAPADAALGAEGAPAVELGEEGEPDEPTRIASMEAGGEAEAEAGLVVAATVGAEGGAAAEARAGEPRPVPGGVRMASLRALQPAPPDAAAPAGAAAGALVGAHGSAAAAARGEVESSLISRGELRLSELRGVLCRQGHSAEFEAGVLVVNGCVRLRRGGAGQVAIDGPWCDDFFAVRQLLYAQFSRI